MTSETATPAAAPPGAPGLHPAMVLSAYLEPLARGRRVAVLGDATIGLAEALVERGARLVHAYDADAARVAEALARAAAGRGPHPTFAPMEGDLGVRDGAFDLVIVPDLSLFPDPAEVLRRARRLVGGSGVVAVAAPNPDAPRRLAPARAAGEELGYYALYDIVSLQFRHVRMLGQAPFVGYTVADFAPDGEPEVSVDTSLLERPEEPEAFLALAADRPVRLDAYAVVEIPFAAALAGAGAAEAAAPPGALAQAEARAARLEAEVAELRALRDRDREGAEARAQVAAATSARLAEAEAELAAKDARFKDVEARAGDAHVRAERFGHQIRDLEEELRTQRERATRLTKQLDDEKRARTKAELEVGMIRNKPEIAGARDRLDSLAAELDAARARVAELEARPPEAVQDPALVLRVEELEAAVTSARREIARLAAERDAARVRAQEIEQALAEEQRGRREAAARHAAHDAERAEIGRGRVAAEERAARLEERAARLEERAARLEDERRAAEAKRAEVEARAQGLAAGAAALEAKVDALEAKVAAFEGERAALARRLAEAEQRDPGEAAAEIAALEAALRDRGRLVAELQGQLQESERVGKELVDELGTLFEGTAGPGPNGGAGGGAAPAGGPGGESGESGGGAPSGGGGAGGAGGVEHAAAERAAEALRLRLDTLSESAARREADLQAAQWRIAQLERELDEARGPEPSPPRVRDALEQALVAARAEVASLRRANLAGARGGVPPEVVEQAVLLEQVAGAAAAGELLRGA